MATIERELGLEADAPVTLTPRAAERVFDFAESASFLRLAVQGGGCGGFMYALQIEEAPQEEDLVLATPRADVNLLIDPLSLPYIQGAVIDFVEGKNLGDSGFKVDNPNAASSCGCGNSFRVDEDSCPSS